MTWAPNFPQWMDGAEQRRFVVLPAGQPLDSSDPTAWVLPLGGAAVKEVLVAGRPVETQVIARTGPGPQDYFMASYVWNDEGTDATLAEAGADTEFTLGDPGTIFSQTVCYKNAWPVRSAQLCLWPMDGKRYFWA